MINIHIGYLSLIKREGRGHHYAPIRPKRADGRQQIIFDAQGGDEVCA